MHVPMDLFVGKDDVVRRCCRMTHGIKQTERSGRDEALQLQETIQALRDELEARAKDAAG